MSKPVFTIGSAAALLLVFGALGGCDKTYQADNSQSVHQDAQAAHSTTAKVANNAERAARDLSRSVTAVAKGVEKGVKEGVQQGQRDAHNRQAYNERSQDSTNRTDRSSDN
jgi:flagellar biosynthesis/type III secretory pathway protein FliH